METLSALLALCVGNSPVTGEFPTKGQWHGALMLSLICAWINGWVNNREAGDLRCHHAHYGVTVMNIMLLQSNQSWSACNSIIDGVLLIWIYYNVTAFMTSIESWTIKYYRMTRGQMRIWNIIIGWSSRQFSSKSIIVTYTFMATHIGILNHGACIRQYISSAWYIINVLVTKCQAS